MRPGLFIALLLVGCGADHLLATEPLESAEIRVIVTITRMGSTVTALSGNAPHRVGLEGVFDDDGVLEVWVFAYSLNDLAAAYPEASTMSATQLASGLRPQLDVPTLDEPPAPSRVLYTRVTRGDRAPEYQERTWAQWLMGSGVRLGFEPTFSRPKRRCEDITFARVDAPDDTSYASIAFANNQTAVAAGPTEWERRADPMRLGRVEGGRFFAFPEDPGFIGRPTEIAISGGDTVFAVSALPGPNQPFIKQVDLRGNDQPPPQLPGDPHVGSVTTADDGTAYFYGNGGIYVVERGGTPRVMSPALPERPKWGRAVRDDRIAFATSASVWFFDGFVWTDEYAVPAFSSVTELDGDTDALIAVGNFELVVVRNDKEGVWVTLDKPWDAGHHFRSVAGLGGGSFIAAANRGGVAVWLDERWCRFDLGPLQGLHAAAASPDGRVALIGGEDPDVAAPGNPASLWQFEIPARR